MDVVAVLQRLGAGRLLDELHEALVATAQEVVDTGKPGSVTLTLKVSTKSQGNPMIIIDETVSRSVPKRDPKGAFFWALEGGLHKDDPRQARMEFRSIDPETGEIREPNGHERVERSIL